MNKQKKINGYNEELLIKVHSELFDVESARSNLEEEHDTLKEQQTELFEMLTTMQDQRDKIADIAEESQKQLKFWMERADYLYRKVDALASFCGFWMLVSVFFAFIYLAYVSKYNSSYVSAAVFAYLALLFGCTVLVDTFDYFVS